ncbi:universal stress protein [Halorussus halophilus]|uniref:universal stress protein n=1 Tax=Halorussus halophilus TaxID=2650975 RepID=UPI001300DAE4|nr:universal stress protein [Halorussus halophilus]
MSFTQFDIGWFSGRGSTHDRPYIAGNFEGEQILVPLLNPSVPAIADQIKVAATLARVKDASLQIVNPVRVPQQTPRGLQERIPDENDHELLQWALDEAATTTQDVSGSFRYGRRLVEAVLESVDRYDSDTVVLPSTTSNGVLRRNLPERISVAVDCDVIVVNGEPGYDEVPSILLPIAGGPHSGLAADIAQTIASQFDAWIDILHVVDEDPSNEERRRASEFVEAAYQRIARPETTTTWILEAEETTDAIVEQSTYYDLTVLGAPTIGPLRRFVYGSTNQSIRADAESVVLSARNNRNPDSLLDDQ